MDDLYRKIGWLLTTEAYRQHYDHPDFIKKNGSVNGSGLARYTGISQSTISRLLRGQPDRRTRGKRQGSEYEISAEVMSGLKKLLKTRNRLTVQKSIADARPPMKLVVSKR